MLLKSAGAIAIAALILPAGAQAKTSKDGHAKRAFYATDASGKLLRFSANKPRKVLRRTITGLPAGVSLAGIDFRPATGDLYGVGSNSVVYRVNTATAIAVPESLMAFTPGLSGTSFGVDFNPVPDRIRLTSDTGQNLRLHPDDGNVVGADKNLNPGMPQIVGSGYTNSSFRAAKPTMTTLYALDAADRLCIQAPPNDGTLAGCKSIAINITPTTGFDIAGADTKNVGFIATTAPGGTGAGLWRVNLATAKTRYLGRIGKGKAAVTGLAAVQDIR